MAEKIERNFLTYEDILRCKGKRVVIDTETNGLNFWENKIIGIGLHCPDADVSGYVETCTFEPRPLGKPKTHKEWKGQMDYSKSKRGRRVEETVTYQPEVMTAIPQEARIRHFLKAVHEMANDPNTVLIGHNLKFDAHFLDLHLWELPCRIVDTSVMVHLYDCRMLKSLGAAELEFLGSESKRHHTSIPEKRFKKTVWRWPAEVIADYCQNDCIVTYQLAEVLFQELEGRGLLGILKAQMDYLRLLQKVEWRGMLVRVEFCEEAIQEFTDNLDQMEKDLFDACGKEFNWRSGDQLSEAIYDGLGIPKPVNPFDNEDEWNIANFRAGKIYTSTATNTPLLIKEKHPLTSLLVDMRETVKLRKDAQKYVLLRDSDGILHCKFNQAKAVTGRLTSSDPNLQNLPALKRKIQLESKYTGGAYRVGGYNLRQALTARPGHTLVSIDHKQQEMRLLAILANEPVMLEAMANREDIHLRVAIEVWGDCGEKDNKLHRDWSKAISFGLIYGLSDLSLQEYLEKLGIEGDAMQLKSDYFKRFPGLRPWFQQVISYVRDNHHVRYWSGRIWWADNPGEGYKGINALIQGGCADFLSVVLIRCNKVLEAQGWGYLVSIIHDEAIFEIEDRYVQIAAAVLSRVMEGEDIFKIPFATDVATGDSYGTLEDLEIPEEVSEINWHEFLKEPVYA